MDGKTALYFLSTVHIVCCVILDSPTNHIIPKTVNNQTSFGFAMAYQETPQRLIVGAPSEDLQGKVYSCDMKNLANNTELSCDENIIDLDKLHVNYTRDVNSGQKFFMGASIVATSDYFFTCAPLVPMDVFNNVDVYGTCIEYDTTSNGTAYIYESEMNTVIKKNMYTIRDFTTLNNQYNGGIGWTTFIDEANDLLLVVKTSLRGDLYYNRRTSPLEPTKSVIPKLHGQYRNIGFAVTALKFFSKDSTVYAFSLMTHEMGARIAFLYWDQKVGLTTVNKTKRYQLVIEDGNLGSMFGAALGAADLNQDGLDDLLVGAPAYSDEETVECGALHIYLGGEKKTVNSGERRRMITGSKNSARFGSTIATLDIDGDLISERIVIIRAPKSHHDLSSLFYFPYAIAPSIRLPHLLEGFRRKSVLEDTFVPFSTCSAKPLAAQVTLRYLNITAHIFLSLLPLVSVSKIFVGAPYEDEVGAVYVFSGFDIHETLMKLGASQMVTISDLKLTKRIVRKDAVGFGFSLLFVSDFDENGCEELAVGSPNNGAVELYYCIQSVTVNITLNRIGEATLDSNTLIVEVCAQVTYPKKPEVVVGEIIVNNNISGVGAYILQPNFTINFACVSCTNETFCKNVTAIFKNTEAAEYEFSTDAQIATFSQKAFNGSEVIASPRSLLTKTIDISRHCQGVSCQPQLSMQLTWSSSNPYVLGSSASETATVLVRNNGNSSYDSCVRVRVRGAAAHVECPSYHSGSGYRCDLLKPLKRYESQTIDIVFNMSKPTNLQANETLIIEAELYENCDQRNPSLHSKSNLTIPYSLLTDHIYLEEGVSSSRQITDKDIMDKHSVYYGIQEFMIKNTGSISWFNISAEISMEKKSYITSYSESSSKCKRIETKDKVLFTCILDLLRNTITKMIVTQNINKTNIESHLKDDIVLNVTSQLSLKFLQTGEIKRKSVTSVLAFHSDRTLVNNKWLIILIAVTVASLLLIIITIVLCKYGFFKRQQKEKLQELRQSIRRRSSKQTTIGPDDGQSEATGDNEDANNVNAGSGETDKTDADMKVADNIDADKLAAYKRHSKTVSTEITEKAQIH